MFVHNEILPLASSKKVVHCSIVETIPYLAKKVKLGKKGGGFYLKIEGWWG